jgi:hypothetical protein
MLSAWIDVPVRCASCGELLTDEVSLEWGINASGRDAPRYQLGATIRWAAVDGSVPSWSIVGRGVANVGSPAERDVIVRSRLAGTSSRCGCTAAVFVRIVDGRIVDVFTSLDDPDHSDYWDYWDYWVADADAPHEWLPCMHRELVSSYRPDDVYGMVVRFADRSETAVLRAAVM